jgi:hypothetical protein
MERTDINIFFTDDLLKLQKEIESEIFRFDSFIYPAIFEEMAKERKEKYIKIFTGIKPKIEKILKDAEKGYDKTARVLLDYNNKENIAMAILAMRNQLIEHSNIDKIDNAYMNGYDIPQKNMGYQLESKDINDKKAIEKLKNEYRDDIDRFIEDFSQKIDGISDQYDNKKKKGLKWTWIALIAALFGSVDSLNYRLSLISKEPFRKSFRRGAVHGIGKIVNKKEKKIIRIVWETTGINPCENCQAMDGREISLEEAESYLHPNCSCTLQVVIG